MRKIFLLMIHFPSDCNSQSCANQKPGARNFLQVSHMGSGYQSFGPSSTAFSGHKQGAGREVEMPGLELMTYGIPGPHAWSSIALLIISQISGIASSMCYSNWQLFIFQAPCDLSSTYILCLVKR